MKQNATNIIKLVFEEKKSECIAILENKKKLEECSCEGTQELIELTSLMKKRGRIKSQIS